MTGSDVTTSYYIKNTYHKKDNMQNDTQKASATDICKSCKHFKILYSKYDN